MTGVTLTEFLLARIAEREADAWEVHKRDCASVGVTSFPCDCGVPERISAECEAERRIVMRHVAIDGVCLGCGIETVAVVPVLGVSIVHCPELRYVAAIYADHPDYREDWRP